MQILERHDWLARQAEHHQQADALTQGYRERKAQGEKHAIDDFLYTYYDTRPARIRRWHPGAGVALEQSNPEEHPSWRWYVTHNGLTYLDRDAFMADRGKTVEFLQDFLDQVTHRKPTFGCFGMHEWAMVYRQKEHRHSLPLRLGQAGTDSVVDSNPIVCTHIDAFRFFTEPAIPLNANLLTRDNQREFDQGGCLHANMDLYKWSMKLSPAVPSALMLECFVLARDIRQVDMQASPYDVSSYNLPAIMVETPHGKSEYARLQREFAARADVLRGRLLELCTQLADAHPAMSLQGE